MSELSNTAQWLDLGAGFSLPRTRWRLWYDHLVWSSHGRRWLLWDCYIGALAAWSAFNLTPYGHQPHGLIIGIFFGLLLGLSSWLCGVPRPESTASRYELLAVSLMAVALGIVLCMIAGLGLAYVRIGRWIWLLFGALAYIGLCAPRLSVSGIESVVRQRLLIYGAGTTGRAVLNELREHPTLHVVGFIDDNRTLWSRCLDGVPCLGGVAQVSVLCRQLEVPLICCAVSGGLPEPRARELLHLRHRGVEIMDIPELYERFTERIPADFISAHWLLHGEKRSLQSVGMLFKRLMDILGALVGLMLTLPLWALIAAAIKCDGPGPVFFRQWRMGLGHRPFLMWKFRSMVTGAEKGGARWAEVHDERVTRLGHWLRLTRLDELPQFMNVLRGEMALVGPRPERPEFLAHIEQVIPYFDQRCLVRPGLTGWAQVRFQYGADMAAVKRKLEYDLYYIHNCSFRLDLQILLRTIVLLMKGSR